MYWIEVLHTLAFHSQWVRLGVMYYDVIALAAAAQCRETWQGDTTSKGRHDDLSLLHVTALDQSYFFIRHINLMRYNNQNCCLADWPIKPVEINMRYNNVDCPHFLCNFNIIWIKSILYIGWRFKWMSHVAMILLRMLWGHCRFFNSNHAFIYLHIWHFQWMSPTLYILCKNHWTLKMLPAKYDQ